MKTLRLMLVLVLAICAATATGLAAPPVCEVGEPNCMPTPEECLSGEYNGVWPGGEPGRLAVCLAAAGHTLAYAGGNASTPCGAIGVVDTYLFAQRDPNQCPPTSAPPGHGVRGTRFREAARGKGGAIASQSAAATAAGAAVLERGGNAIDAAAATVFAVGVQRPEMCGIGGRGFLLYRSASGEVASLDFQSTAPMAVTPTSMQGTGAHTIGSGRRVLGVPGVVAGMHEALHRYGTISLADAIAPAERMARDGIRVSPELAASYQAPAMIPGTPVAINYAHTLRLSLFRQSAAIYLKNGVLPYQPSDLLVQTDYANSLKLIAEQGPDAFYRGAITDKIVAAMDDFSAYPGNEGLLTAADFDAFRAVWRDPIVSSYRGAEILAVPPPSSALTVVETLNILEGFDLAAAGHSSADHLHLAAEAQKIGFADHDTHLADPDFVSVPISTLASQSYADTRGAEIELGRAKSYAPGQFGTGASSSAALSEAHTTHVSVVDAAGNAVSVTCSLGLIFGSAWVAPGAGFPFSQVLNLFSEPGTANEPRGGKRPLTAMSPIIVARDGRPVLVAGASGGDRIQMGVTLAASNVLDFSLDVARASDAARIDERACCTLLIEDGRVLPAVLDELSRRGHELAGSGEYDGEPLVQVAAWDLLTDEQVAAFDPRNEGAAAAPGGP